MKEKLLIYGIRAIIEAIDSNESINKEIDFGFDSIKLLKSEIVKKLIGEIVATTP